jgi:hypothetical protein
MAAALGVGFRPHANAAEWLAALGVVLLLTGTRIGDDLVITIAWCAWVTVLSYAWSRKRYEREPRV